MDPDQRAIARAAEGDRGGLGDLADRHRDWLIRRQRAKGFPPDLAEDAVQEAFVRLLQRCGDIRRPESVRYWLDTVASNIARDELRRAQIPIPKADVEAWTRDVGDVPELHLEGREIGRRLQESAAGLSDRDRHLLCEAFAFDRQPREIATREGSEYNAVRRALHRARLRWRNAFEQTPALTPVAELVRRWRQVIPDMAYALVIPGLAASLAVVLGVVDASDSGRTQAPAGPERVLASVDPDEIDLPIRRPAGVPAPMALVARQLTATSNELSHGPKRVLVPGALAVRQVPREQAPHADPDLRVALAPGGVDLFELSIVVQPEDYPPPLNHVAGMARSSLGGLCIGCS